MKALIAILWLVASVILAACVYDIIKEIIYRLDIPRIKRMNKGWIVGTKKNGFDICDTFRQAVRYWLWHCGLPPKIAFGWFKRPDEMIPPFLFRPSKLKKK